MSRKMKESGIDWIGSIPMPWNTIKFKYLHGGMNTGEGIDKNFWSNEPGRQIILYRWNKSY